MDFGGHEKMLLSQFLKHEEVKKVCPSFFFLLVTQQSALAVRERSVT